MIGITCLNLSLDKTYFIDGFNPGEIYRPAETEQHCGGKGVNVARVLKALKKKSEIIGFSGGYTGRFIEQKLKEEGMDASVVNSRNPSRTCSIIVDRAAGKYTVINETGHQVLNTEISSFQKKYKQFIKDKKFLIFSGSIQPSINPNIYLKLIETAKERNIVTMLDTGGRALREGIKAIPSIIKINIDEFASISSTGLKTAGQLKNSMGKLLNSGTEWVVVTMGKNGIIAGKRNIIAGNRFFRIPSVKASAVNAIGSGDAFAAGFSAGWLEKKGDEHMLRLGVACATANTLAGTPGLCRPEDIKKFYRQARVYKI